MKRWLLLAGIVVLGVAAVIVTERRKVDVPASPAALLYLIADTEQELTRMPVSFTRMPDTEEIQIGNELAHSYAIGEERDKPPEVIAVETYLTQVGLRLASHAHRRLPYRFHYLPDAYMINAFALPGGHVYVGGGLLALMDSEDELAAVVGHEIEHIDHYHCAERVQREQALHKIPFGGLMALPIEVFEAGYSKDQELEADREGTRLAVEAGYSPHGAIRMFETFDRLYKQYQAQPKTPQEEASRVALETLEGYFRSHPLPSERIAQVQTMISSEGWAARPERDLAVAYIFWTAKAEQELDAHRYAQAEQLASRSLRLQPDQPKALEVLARAQFAQANFSGAADAYRKLLESKTLPLDAVYFYAQALAAADRKNAVIEFRQWEGQYKGARPREMELGAAGLALLAGDPEPARKLESALWGDRSPQAPAYIGKLGWWYYLAEDYPKAVDLLSQAAQLRPGDTSLRRWLAWALIEVRRYSDALQTIGVDYERQSEFRLAMVAAAARWRAQEKDLALRDFDVAIAVQPEWENPNWVKALYSPAVTQNVEEMRAERERRRARARAQTHDSMQLP